MSSELDLDAAGAVLAGLRPYPVAVTTVAGGHANGLISLSAGSGSVLYEAPRVQISLAKRNLTHDMVTESGVFVMHLLADGDADVLNRSLGIIMGLGGRSGRDVDKMVEFDAKTGETGAPILLDALSYVEARVVATLDTEENTLFHADVVAAGRLRKARRLDIGSAWNALPPAWTSAYEAGLVIEYDAARRRRGLPEQVS